MKLNFSQKNTKNCIAIQVNYMSWHVTANEITRWSEANSRRAQEILPKIVKKLILATINSKYMSRAREFFKNQRLETGMNNSYLFLNTKNTYYGSNLALYKNYKSVLKKLNIEARTLHNTRHTFASMMLNNGIDLMWVSNTLGHENLDITLRVYTHFMPKKEKMVIEFLEKRYKNGTHY